jgi:hypothetical protein
VDEKSFLEQVFLSGEYCLPKPKWHTACWALYIGSLELSQRSYKESKMSIARITTAVFSSKQAADNVAQAVAKNAGNLFPSAEQLLGIQSDGNTLVSVGIYANQQEMEKADAAKDKVMSNPDIVSIETVIGNVKINHTN